MLMAASELGISDTQGCGRVLGLPQSAAGQNPACRQVTACGHKARQHRVCACITLLRLACRTKAPVVVFPGWVQDLAFPVPWSGVQSTAKYPGCMQLISKQAPAGAAKKAASPHSRLASSAVSGLMGLRSDHAFKLTKTGVNTRTHLGVDSMLSFLAWKAAQAQPQIRGCGRDFVALDSG